MPEVLYIKASDKEINACKGNHCGACQNRDRCLQLYHDNSIRERIDEYLYNLIPIRR